MWVQVCHVSPHAKCFNQHDSPEKYHSFTLGKRSDMKHIEEWKLAFIIAYIMDVTSALTEVLMLARGMVTPILSVTMR